MNLNQTLTAFRICIELIASNIAFGISNYVIFNHFWVDGWSYPSLFLVVNFVTLVSYYITGQRFLNPSFRKREFLKTICLGVILNVFIVSIYWLIVYDHRYYLVHLILFSLFLFIFHFIFKYLWMMVMMRIMPGLFTTKNVLLILPHANGIEDIIRKNSWMKLNVSGILTEGTKNDISLYTEQYSIDIIFCDKNYYLPHREEIHSNKQIKWLIYSTSKPDGLVLDRIIEGFYFYSPKND